MSNVLLIEVDGTRGWVTPRTANRLIRDRSAKVESRNPLVIRERARIRVMRSRFEDESRSARYLTSGGFALGLYRDDLRAALQLSCQGKPGNIESEEYVDLQRRKSDRFVRTPYGLGRE